MRMPHVTRLAAPLALTALCTLPAAAQSFEGVITWQMGGDRTVVQTMKGEQMKTDMGQGYMIMDLAAQTMSMVMPEQKMYMVADLKAAADRAEKENGPAKMPRITATGKSETIAGKSCEIYRFAKEEGQPDNMEVCAAKGMGFYMGGRRGPMGGGRGGNGPGSDVAYMTTAMANPEFAKAYKDGFFPLRVTSLKDGSRNIMLVTKIEPKSIDASAFAIPSDYHKMDMPAGMGGMGGPPRN